MGTLFHPLMNALETFTLKQTSCTGAFVAILGIQPGISEDRVSLQMLSPIRPAEKQTRGRSFFSWNRMEAVGQIVGSREC